MYFKLLLLVHIAGAVGGFGPTFAFGILGQMAGPGAPSEQRLTIMEALYKINRSMVYPVVFVTQPLTGVLLIFQTHRNRGFFSHEWLWIAVSLYLVALAVVAFLDAPAFRRVYALAREGRTDSSEYQRLSKRSRITGPLLGAIVTVILFLMVWKPGG